MNSGIEHNLIMIDHNSRNKRELYSCKLCDTWGVVKEKMEIKLSSSNASNCQLIVVIIE